MKLEFVLLLCLVTLGSALHANISHLEEFPTGTANVASASTQKLMTRCDSCRSGSPRYANSLISTTETNPNAAGTVWKFEKVGTKIAIKSDKGTYVGRCPKCLTSSPRDDSVLSFLYVPSINRLAQFEPQKLANGNWAFKADTGKYLGVCKGCISGEPNSEYVFANVDSKENPLAQWRIYYFNAQGKPTYTYQAPTTTVIIRNATPAVSSPADTFLSKFPSGVVNLQSETGKYLSRCENCGAPNPGYPYANSASIHETNPRNPTAIWSVVKIGDKIALRADNGLFLSRCYYCWKQSAYPNSVFVHVPEEEMRRSAYAQWTPELLSDGTWAFKSDVGTYLARCNNCVTGGKYPDMAFLVFSDTRMGTSHWKVTPAVSFPTSGKINLQCDNGGYLARCQGCGVRGKYINSATVHEKNPKGAWATWTVEKVGDKIALKADNGAYLALCPKCWPNSKYPDAVFVHVNNVNGNPNALWSPEPLPDGTWALKASSGNYLAWCYNCLPGSTLDITVAAYPHNNYMASHWKLFIAQ